MHKLTLLLTAIIAGNAVMSANAATAVPFRIASELPRANAPAAETVVEEHFDKFTAGSETAPDAAVVNGENNALPEEMMAAPGWIGGGVHQAGGCAALMAYRYNPYPEYGDMYEQTVGGYITTPYTALYGDIELTFRIKRLPGSIAEEEGETPRVWAVICDDYEGPVDAGAYFNATDEWQQFTFTSSAATFGQCAIQISAVATDVLIDDIRLTRVCNTMPAPGTVSITNLSPSSFRASWDAVTDADKYLVNVFRKETPATDIPAGSITESFDGINASGGKIDASAPNYPEGWNINVSAAGTQDVPVDGSMCCSAPISIRFDAEGDEMTSPETPLPITRLSFWAKADAPDPEDTGEYSLSLLGVKFFCNGKWEHYANIPYYWLEEDGGYYVMDNIPENAENATRVMFTMEQKNIANFYIDDVTIDYAPVPMPVPVVTDAETSATEYTLDSYDTAYEHFVNVTAASGEIKSAPSDNAWVDGLIGLKPQFTSAQATSPTTIEAAWTELSNAQTYRVKTTRTLTAAQDMSGVTVLHEDFSRVTVGTVDSPEAIYSAGAYNLGENGQADTDWVATQGQLAQGMAGTRGTSWLGEAGLVATPRISLSNGGGAFDVTVTTVFTPNHEALGEAGPDGIFVMLLNDVTDTQASDHQFIPYQQGETGEKTATVHFNPVSTYPEKPIRDNVLVAFMSASGTGFLLDEVTITQDMKAGETMTVPFKAYDCTATPATMEGFPSDSEFSLTVQASAVKNTYTYASEVSDPVTVKMSSGVDNIAADSEADGTAVVAGKSKVTITADGMARILTLDGIARAAVECDGTPIDVSLPAGIYIVNVSGQSVKVAVR